MPGNNSSARLSGMSGKITSRRGRFPNSPRKYVRKRCGIRNPRTSNTAQLNPQYFSRRPVLTNLNKDLEKSKSLENIITNIPEVEEEYDVPDYVKLDAFINEEKIEMDLIHKYMTHPICDENGYYINDHDYLGLPIIRRRTENPQRNIKYDHTYSLSEHPACLYSDLRHFCNICQHNNLNLFTFNTHMMKHTIKNDVVCLICCQKFLTTTCLNNHIATHRTVCDICGSEVPSVQILAHQEANIQQMKALKAKNQYKVTQKQKIHFCVICMKSFSKRDYMKHVASHVIIKNKGKMKKNIKKTVYGVKKFLPF